MNLQDHKLYTSSEVSEILGVSLRSVYRYLEEGKLEAEVKTATGRHRFTKQNILDFLYPNDANRAKNDAFSENANAVRQTAPARESTTRRSQDYNEGSSAEEGESTKRVEAEEVPEDTTPEEEKVDWLEKFRAAAERHRAQMTQAVPESAQDVREEKPAPVVEPEPIQREDAPQPAEEIFGIQAAVAEEPQYADAQDSVYEDVEEERAFYYKSGITSLVELAQTVNKTARRSDVDYAFTMNAGLSLYKRVRPFSTLHIYVRPGDREFFERALDLTEVPETSAQLCVYLGDDKVFNSRKEVHGLFVVSDLQLKNDLMENGEEDLAAEFEDMLKG